MAAAVSSGARRFEALALVTEQPVLASDDVAIIAEFGDLAVLFAGPDGILAQTVHVRARRLIDRARGPRSTTCYSLLVETISQREMRNSSGEVLRRVKSGESILVANNGTPVAMLVPVPSTPEGRVDRHGHHHAGSQAPRPACLDSLRPS